MFCQTSSMRREIVFVLLFVLLSQLAAEDPILSQNELRTKYGQENTTFNDGRSCYRQCDGRRKTCYYEFNVQFYDTLSVLCGACQNGTISDCFKNGCITGNGVARTVMTVNHKLPGPSINVCKNDRIIVDVTNHMAGQELSFHWHGLHQKETPWFDGVPMITQCPIFSGNSFRYIFNAREAGTHYYHAHSGLHRMNGLFGKLNVRDADDPNKDFYDYDLDEHSILLADWINEMAENMTPGTIGRFQEATQPESLLINGFGSYFNTSSNEFLYAPIAVLYVERGKRHRIRIDDAASLNCPLELSIKDHNLTVIATDGFSIEPIVVDSVVLAAGERFDVVIEAMDDPNINETLLTVRGLNVCKLIKLQEFARIIFVDDIKNYTKYDEDHQPLKFRPSYDSLNITKKSLNNADADCTKPESYCIPSLKQKQVPASVGGNLRNEEAEVVRFQFQSLGIKSPSRPSNYKTIGRTPTSDVINNISNIEPPMPILTQDDSGIRYCNKDNLPDNCNNETACYCTHLVALGLCKLYEFLLIDGRIQSRGVHHPIHLHGHAFQVLDTGTKVQLESGNTAFANATHLPVVKDTVVIPSKGFTKIRFRSCNPGYWFFHCHLEFHMHSGMTAVIKVGDRSDMLQPPPDFPTCGNYLTPVRDNF